MDWANNQISDRENKIAQGLKKNTTFYYQMLVILPT